MVCTLLASINVVAFAADDLVVSVHCFYNDADKGGDGEHLYTKDLDEMSWLSSLPTWNNQGEAWKAPVSSSLAIYRVYNPNSGEHHYAAADEAEWLVKDMGWTQEKLAFYSDDNKGVPVYRLWNGLAGVGSHYYTTNEFEKDILVAGGWQFEGVNFYGVKGEEPTTKALSAAQVGSDKIMVSSEDGFTGEESFVVSHGDLVDELAGAEYDEDLDVYTITLANPIVEAVYTVSCDGYTPATFEGEESEKEMTAVQTGAKEITVTLSEEASDDDEFTVTCGALDVDVEDVTPLGNVVVITLEDELDDDVYTVTCSDSEYEPVDVECEAAELTDIVFDDNKLLVATDNTYSAATIDVWAVDQWDDKIDYDFTDASFTALGSNVNPQATYANGKLTVNAVANTALAPNSEVKVTVVYNGNIKWDEETLTVTGPSVVNGIVVGDLTLNENNTHAAAFADKRITTAKLDSANADSPINYPYFLPMVFVDQYGNTLNADELNGMVTAQTPSLYVTPNLTSTLGQYGVATPVLTTANGGFFDIPGMDGFVGLFVAGNGAATSYGTSVINFLSANGYNETKTITVAANEVVDEISFDVGTLQDGKAKPATLSVKDQYGDDYALVPNRNITLNAPTNDTLTITGPSGEPSTITIVNGVFAFDALTGGITVGGVGPATTAYITTQSATNKYNTLSRTIEAAATPKTIAGLDPTVDTTITIAGLNPTVDLKTNTPVLFYDTDGDIYNGGVAYAQNEAAMGGAGYYYTVTAPTTMTCTTFSAISGIISSNGVAGPKSDRYTITLYQKTATGAVKALDNHKVDIAVAGTPVSYTAVLYTQDVNVTDPLWAGDLLYVGNTDMTANIKVMATDKAGNVFEVPFGGQFNAVFAGGGTTHNFKTDGATPVNGAIAITGGTISVTAAAAVTPTSGTVTDSVEIDIYAGDVKVDTVELNYSNVPSMMADIICLDVTTPATPVPYDLSQGFTVVSGVGGYLVSMDGKNDAILITDGNGARYMISASDQYGYSNLAGSMLGKNVLANNDAGLFVAPGATLLVKCGPLVSQEVTVIAVTP